MKVLITGDAGFVGTHLKKKFDEVGIEYQGYDLVRHEDIRDEINLDMAFRQLGKDGMVVHLAALAGVRDGEDRPNEYLDTNVVGTQNVITMCKKYEVKHLISFSSSSVLGNQTPHEAGSLETDPTAPIAVYGLSKECGEKLIRHSKLFASIIRPFTIYGDNGRPNQVIYKWINTIKAGKPIPFFGDGNTKRGYTYEGDLTDGIVKLITCVQEGKIDPSQNRCEVYNFGGSQITTLNDLYKLFQDVVGEIEREMLPLPDGDVPQNWADTTKAENAIGFKADTDFNTEVTRIIKQELNK